VENSRFDTFLAHAETGFMAECPAIDGAPAPSERIIEFITAILGTQSWGLQDGGKGPGAFVVFVGLDGSGKTTVARKLCMLGVEQQRFNAIRYFHWQPRLFGGPEFPLPEPENVARKKPLQPNAVRAVVSVVRLVKNLAQANLAYRLRTRRLLRRGTLVVVDRYYYNYFLDPVSVKYYGPNWVLERLAKRFPRPDLVVVFKAPAEVLRSRKQELTSEEITRQMAVLEKVQFNARELMVVDACQPPLKTAEGVLKRAGEI
jgi:thymidylate kinase